MVEPRGITKNLEILDSLPFYKTIINVVSFDQVPV